MPSRVDRVNRTVFIVLGVLLLGIAAVGLLTSFGVFSRGSGGRPVVNGRTAALSSRVHARLAASSAASSHSEVTWMFSGASRCPIAIARCHIEQPPMLDLAPGHRTACWRPYEALA